MSKDIIHISEDGEMEFWYARELQPLLGDSRWEYFELVINKAIIACENADGNIGDHFRGVTKMIKLAKSVEKSVKEYVLTRYACWLIEDLKKLERRVKKDERKLMKK